jgi:hypothetical protein
LRNFKAHRNIDIGSMGVIMNVRFFMSELNSSTNIVAMHDLDSAKVISQCVQFALGMIKH